MLTKEQSDKLKDFFSVRAHEFLNGNTYLTEESITDRLDEVDPSWEFHKLEIARNGVTVTAVYRMTVCGVARDGVGMATVQLSKDKDREVNEAEKSAATDALKRCARLFGIGRYILEMGKAVSDYRTLETWLIAQRKINPQTGEIKLVQNGTQKPQEAVLSDLNDSMGDLEQAQQNAAKTAAERLGTPSKQTVAPRTAAPAHNIGEFKTRILKEFYNNNTFHMNGSLKKLTDAGLYHPGLTLEQAIDVVKNRKEEPVSEAG